MSDSKLSELRSQIDALDAEILKALNARAAKAQAIGQIKHQNGSPIFRPDRELAIIEALQAKNLGPLKPEGIAAIWRELMSACRALEKAQTVAYLGPAGTFSEQAALSYFGSSMAFLPCDDIDEVFEAVSHGRAEFAVAPIENSTEGAVVRSLDLLRESPAHIVGCVDLKVEHHLLTQATDLKAIQTVAAHPQALAQCHHWLQQHLPQAKRQPMQSNTQGAQLAVNDAQIAGIASVRAATLLGLPIAAHAIQDAVDNVTRFAVLCLPTTLHLPHASGRDITSLVVSMPNKPGAMHDLLVPLKKHGVSMTRLESRPARSGQTWTYCFYIDLEGHPEDASVKAALDELQTLCTFFKMLGVYARGQ